MAIKDNVVTLTGINAAVRGIGIMVQPDGSYTIEAVGHTKDGFGNLVNLSPYQGSFLPGALPALDNFIAAALTQLRKLNGLE